MKKHYSFLLPLSLSSIVYANMESNTSLAVALNDENRTVNVSHVKKIHLYSEDELKLMYQVFVYNSDLKAAKRVVDQALKIYPEKIYWHMKSLELAQWLNDANGRLKELEYLAKKEQTPAFREALLQASIDAKRYDIALPLIRKKLMNHPSPKNVDTFIYVYSKEDRIIEAIKTLYQSFLKYPSKPFLIEAALQLSLDQKNAFWSKKLIAEMEKRSMDTKRSVSLRVWHYTQEKDKLSVYLTLKQRLQSCQISKCNDIAFLRQISDLGWQEGDQELAIKVSYRLFVLHKARVVDYERIIFYGYKDPRFSKNAIAIAQNAYAISHNTYMLQSVLYQLVSHQEIQKAYQMTLQLDQNARMYQALQKDRHYIFLKLQILLALNDPKVIDTFFSDYPLLKRDPQVISSVLWNYINTRQIRELNKLLVYLEEHPVNSPLVWLPMASAYFTLQKVDRSKKYVKKLLKKHPDNIDLHFLYAYILQSEGNEDGFMKEISFIYQELSYQKKCDPSLTKQSDFVTKYLNSAMYVISADQFLELLKQYRPVMKKDSYNLVLISWGMKNRTYNKVSYIEKRIAVIEPWLKLSIALNQKDNAKVQDLLYHYYRILSIHDRVVAATKTHNIAMAYTLAFEGVESSENDNNMYRQFVGLSEQRSNYVEVNSGVLNRADSLFQTYFSLNSRAYLSKGYWLTFAFDRRKNRVTDSRFLRNVEPYETAIEVGVKKEFNRGNLEVDLGYENAMKSYFFAKGIFFWQWSDRFSSKLSLLWHTRAYETTYVLLGGYKDAYNIELSYYLQPSLQFILNAEYSNYSSQNDIDLGDGSHALLLMRHYLRRGYPDISAAAFIEYGNYHETDNSKKLIDELMPGDYRALPDNFANIGLNVQYGLQNEVNYVRPWRPFGEATVIYDLKNSNFSYAVRAGISGSFGTQGKLNIGIDYNQAVYGTNETSYTCYMKYKFFY